MYQFLQVLVILVHLEVPLGPVVQVILQFHLVLEFHVVRTVLDFLQFQYPL